MNPLTTELPVLTLEGADELSLESTVRREWLVTNGLGGYAAGTIALCNTRKHHGLFVPSVTGHGRMAMLPRLEEEAFVAGVWRPLQGEEDEATGLHCEGVAHLKSFQVNGLIPEWTYNLGGVELRRRVVIVHGENTVYVLYNANQELRLRLRPYPAFRRHDELWHGQFSPSVFIHRDKVQMVAAPDAVPLRLRLRSDCEAPFTAMPKMSCRQVFRVDKSRGDPTTETLESPGYFECRITPGNPMALAATIGEWPALDRAPSAVVEMERERERRLLDRAPAKAREGVAARLVLAADQFIIEPSTRPQDEAWARATGQDARSVIAGYHWFTEWGRDTMISLDGLTLKTGRHREAAAILKTFQHYIQDGLIPNFFPDGEHHGVYHTADATLWFFHSVHRYLQETSDVGLLRDLFPSLASIIDHHVHGTRFNIHVDPTDGLISQGEQGYQLTWMDAKVDGWVVTPRRGKAVEINALWFNALSLMADWAGIVGAPADLYRSLAERARAAFNQRFWNPAENCLFDIVDKEGGGGDPAVRPNQVFAVSLHHPVLDRRYWAPVLTRVRDDLLTPVGLRTLSPSHPDYKAKYDGDLRARDAAYHQGTVWPWLLGHFIDAWMKHEPDKTIGRGLLSGLEKHLRQVCMGQAGEIFDASAPFNPRGCVAQAWSVAEMLRVWLETS